MNNQAKHGFTLIELLIVVTIIAVLAAIAVPNFLEAQVRSKVARTVNDLRTLSTALEVYRVDTNGYPVVPLLYHPLGARLACLTTPISYLGELPKDPFAVHNPQDTLAGLESFYVYASGNLYAGGASQFDKQEYYNSIFSVAGRGPDRGITFGGYCMAHPQAIRGQAPVRGAYDPTNGTVSAGDIFRLGGGRISDGM
jgi:type II secretion system protein G